MCVIQSKSAFLLLNNNDLDMNLSIIYFFTTVNSNIKRVLTKALINDHVQDAATAF